MKHINFLATGRHDPGTQPVCVQGSVLVLREKDEFKQINEINVQSAKKKAIEVLLL